MKHVIFDCDNTLGVKDCDVDDGLALLYLLGCEEVTVHGVNPLEQSKVRQEIISQRWQENTKANFPFLQPGRLRI